MPRARRTGVPRATREREGPGSPGTKQRVCLAEASGLGSAGGGGGARQARGRRGAREVWLAGRRGKDPPPQGLGARCALAPSRVVRTWAAGGAVPGSAVALRGAVLPAAR